MSNASDRVKAAMESLGTTGTDVVLKRNTSAESAKIASDDASAQATSESAFVAAQAEVDAAIEALRAEKSTIVTTVNPA